MLVPHARIFHCGTKLREGRCSEGDAPDTPMPSVIRLGGSKPSENTYQDWQHALDWTCLFISILLIQTCAVRRASVDTKPHTERS